MLVRKCDVCDHILGDEEEGYMIDIYKTSMPRGAWTKTLDSSLEICSECKQVMFRTFLNERVAKYMLIEKEREDEI